MSRAGISHVFWGCWWPELLLPSIFKGHSDFLIVLLPELLGNVALVELLHELFVLGGIIISELATINRETILVERDPDLCIWPIGVSSIFILLGILLSLFNDAFDVIWVLYRHTRLFSTSVRFSCLFILLVLYKKTLMDHKLLTLIIAKSSKHLY